MMSPSFLSALTNTFKDLGTTLAEAGRGALEVKAAFDSLGEVFGQMPSDDQLTQQMREEMANNMERALRQQYLLQQAAGRELAAETPSPEPKPRRAISFDGRLTG